MAKEVINPQTKAADRIIHVLPSKIQTYI